MDDLFLPGLPVDLIRAAFARAPGNEIESGKLGSLESSAALAANTFGLFLDRPDDLSPLPGVEHWEWPALSVQLETIVRFPWRGGRHPCLDVLIETHTALIGVESKRYEPFRSRSKAKFSEAYWRPVWGDAMAGYESVRDGLHDVSIAFIHFDAAQLVKHAFGLRTAVHRDQRLRGKKPILFYLYAEPQRWPDGSLVPIEDIAAHRAEITRFSKTVANNDVAFEFCSYGDLLAFWEHDSNEIVSSHARAIKDRFAP